MPDNSFDVVSKIDLQEVSNAIQQALKEIHTRFDLKDSKSNIELDKDGIVLHSADEYKLKAVNDVLQQKMVKRGVSLKGLTYGAVEPAAGGAAKRRITLQQGIPIEKAREIVKKIKDSNKELAAGLDLLLKEFTKIFEAEGVRPIETKGKPLNYDLHEVLGFIETNEHPEGTVLEELQRGYTFQNKVLRPAKVRIAKPKVKLKDQEDAS